MNPFERCIHVSIAVIPVLAAALCALASSGVAAEIDHLPVIDCHVHLWDTSRPGMTWPKKEQVELYKPFLPATHEPLCQASGVSGVVVVLSGQALEDNQWNLEVTAHNPALYCGVIGNLSKVIGTAEFEPLFRKLCQDKRYVGYRLSGRYTDGLTEGLLRDLQLTAEMGRTVDFLVDGYSLADVDEIARRIPKLNIILDHLGNIVLSDKPLDPAWVSAFRSVAQRPNVFCKVSALYGRFARQPAPKDLATYQPVLDLALESFGEDRLIYGSDWPVANLTADYQSVLDLTKSYFATKDPRLAKKVFHDNAVKFYGLAGQNAE